MGTSAPAGQVLLEVQLRYGRITYLPEEHVGYRERWQPPEWQLADLSDRYKTKPEVTVQFIADGRGGASCRVVDSPAPDCCTWVMNGLRSCFFWTGRLLMACVLGLIHCVGWLWGWLCDDRRRWKNYFPQFSLDTSFLTKIESKISLLYSAEEMLLTPTWETIELVPWAEMISFALAFEINKKLQVNKHS